MAAPGRRVVAVVAQKGGVGKTTTTVHLAAVFARRGVPTLVVDLDPQAAATALLAPSEVPAAGTAEVLLEGAALADVAVPTPSGVELVAATDAMGRVELALASEVGREAFLRAALESAPADRWRLVLLDTPPSLGLLTANALCAAGWTLTPVLPALLSLASVRQLEATVATVRQRLNRGLRPLGYVLTAVDARERLADEARDTLRKHAGNLLWKAEARVSADLKSALAGDLHGRAREDFDALAVELARRLELHLPAEGDDKRQARLFNDGE